jgi:quinol monooxygenase YgiN/catechol 2,3-dioxygenase-like lactoylglutathione lyase family enzyme
MPNMNSPEPPVLGGIHHLKLPVSDLEHSTKWYSAVLGARRLTQLDHRRPDGTLFAVILEVPGLEAPVELRLDPATAGALDGYDFLTLAVEDRAALDGWIAHLDALGIPHSPPIVALVGWLLVVPDPDGLRLRIYTSQPHGLDVSRVEFDSPWLSIGPTAPSAAAGAAPERVVCFVARLRALPGGADELQPLLHSLAQATRQETGCLVYRVHRAQDEPDTFVVYEEWAGQAALTAHQNTAHMQTFRKTAGHLIDGPPHTEPLTPCD